MVCFLAESFAVRTPGRGLEVGTVPPLVTLSRAVDTSLFLPTAFGYVSKPLALVAPGDSQMVVHPAAAEVDIEPSAMQEDFPEAEETSQIQCPLPMS